jgi:acyl dehydratase
MSTAANGFDLSLVGVTSDPVTFTVERDRIVAYAEATNDDLAPHAAGEYAPPVFAVVPAFETLAATSVKPVPQEILMRVVHGEQDFRFHAPILPGQQLTSTASVIGVTPKSSGVTVCVLAKTVDQDGTPIVDQYMTAFFRGAELDAGAGAAPPEHAFPAELRGTEPAAVVAQRFDADQTHRYAPAAGDPMPIHTDEAFAKAMGLPGIIIHGLCTMAFTSRAIIQTACPGDPTRLRRLAVRFSKPCRPGEEISTAIWDHGDGAWVFETTDATGAAVIRDGRAEVAAA